MKTKYYKKPVVKTNPAAKFKTNNRKIGFPKTCGEEGCGVKIIYLPTKLGKWMPVEFDSMPPEDLHEINLGGVVFYAKEKHQTHFGKCKGTEKFSRK